MNATYCAVSSPRIDETGSLVKINADGLVKIDCLTACRRVLRGGVIYIQFHDRDKMRSALRGSEFVEIPLTVLCEKLGIGAELKESVDA